MDWVKKLLVVATIFQLSSCGEGGAPQSSEVSNINNNKPRIALVMKSLANEFFVNMASGAEAHQSANSDQYELLVNGIRNESDLAQQVALVDQMISSGVDAIVIAPADSRALVPALSRAMSEGIVVINIDNRLEPKVLAEYELLVPFIGPSNREGAKMVGDYLLQDSKNGDQVAILEGIPAAFNSIERRAGFEEAVAAAELEVVALQSANWDQTRSAQVTSGILQQFPDLDFILAANDNMALGAASAVRLASLATQVKIAGFDNISAIHPLIESGAVAATVDQFGDQLAVFGIEYALEVLTTGAIPEDRETPLELVTKESLLPN